MRYTIPQIMNMPAALKKRWIVMAVLTGLSIVISLTTIDSRLTGYLWFLGFGNFVAEIIVAYAIFRPTSKSTMLLVVGLIVGILASGPVIIFATLFLGPFSVFFFPTIVINVILIFLFKKWWKALPAA